MTVIRVSELNIDDNGSALVQVMTILAGAEEFDKYFSESKINFYGFRGIVKVIG